MIYTSSMSTELRTITHRIPCLHATFTYFHCAPISWHIYFPMHYNINLCLCASCFSLSGYKTLHSGCYFLHFSSSPSKHYIRTAILSIPNFTSSFPCYTFFNSNTKEQSGIINFHKLRILSIQISFKQFRKVVFLCCM